MPSWSPLVEGIRVALVDAADPALAPGMQQYMKSQMPYLGVRVQQVRQLVKAQLALHPPASVQELGLAAADLWRRAEYREERYAATGLTGSKTGRGRLELLALHREMIVTGAWWDHVDEVSHRIGELLAAHPASMRPVVLDWSREPDVWLRRSSIICQLRRCGETDLELLTAVITANMSEREFFVRKAIGWALRDYAWTDPDWVLAFVDTHAGSLSPLSVREATKHIS